MIVLSQATFDVARLCEAPMPFHIRLFLTQPLASWFMIALLVLRSGPAYAEWEQIYKTDDGMTLYVDPDSIRRKEDLVKM